MTKTIVKMLFIGYIYGIRSERKLEQENFVKDFQVVIFLGWLYIEDFTHKRVISKMKIYI
jgi:hypothetical protein